MALFFYLFAGLIIASSIMVIRSSNPVHAVLWLIFAFCNGSGLMVIIGAEFIAMMLIIIYVGAVAVLFLFVVMMLDVKFTELKGNELYGSAARENAITFFIALLLFADIVLVILLASKSLAPDKTDLLLQIPSEITNAHAIGNLLYTTFFIPFQISGVVLFVAMIATISLTLRLRAGVKRQKVSVQMKRNKDNSLDVSKINCKNGVEGLNYDN